MSETNRAEAEKAYRQAEELFLAGNIVKAQRLARRANRLFHSLPGLADALAAYAVHAAAIADAAGSRNWHAVLDLNPRSATRDAVKRSLLIHPDKNRSAAADGAFKLLRQAFDVLCEIYGRRDAFSESRGRRDDFSESRRRDEEAGARAPEPEPPGRRSYQRVYCPDCELEFGRSIGTLEELAGTHCRWCNRRIMPPFARKPAQADPRPGKKPSAPPPPTFRCPAQCPHCGEQFTSMVSAGPWKLQCKACSKAVMIKVQGPEKATCCSR